MRSIKTTCAYCGVGCGIKASVTGKRSVTIEGDVDHPANRGSLCSKGTHLGETVGLEGRLLLPMIGGEPVSWDQATTEVASRMKTCIDEHGPDSVAFYVSGQLLTEDYYIANKLMKGFVGSSNIDTNSRLCMASAVAAHNRAFGEDIVPCTYEDLDHADVILLVGSNTAWCHPVIWQRIEKAREENGTKLVVIDPRRTETAERADLHISVEPDGDVALFDALLAASDLDHAKVAETCEVPEGFWDSRSPDHGIDPQLFAELTQMVAGSQNLITLFSQGANQSRCGTDKGNAIINLHLATGHINRRGAGPFSITGQPNAMGGREVGGLANMLACHMGFSDEERSAVGEFWQTDRISQDMGLKAVDMFEAVHRGDIKFIWVMATNPAVSMPNASRVREALERCETVVISEVLEDTDTGRLAHIKLPALGWGEKDGTVTNSERVVSHQRALFPAPGEARADWRIMVDVARAMGFEAAFDFDTPASVFREYCAMTAISAARGRKLDMTHWADCSDDEYEAMEPFRWGGDHPLAAGYPTRSGKAKLIPVSAPERRPLPDAFPMRLNTARYRDQWHTMTRTGYSPRLAHHRREPLVEVHHDDALALGIADGDLAKVATKHGSSLYRAQLSAGQQRGTLCVPMHWTDITASAGRTGKLSSDDTDPFSGQPGFKDAPAFLESVVPAWRGFLVSRINVETAPETFLGEYWVKSRVEGGWLYELAGMQELDFASLLPVGALSEVSFPSKGMQRFAVCDEGGVLDAALFITRNGDLPARDWVAKQLGEPLEDLPALLAGRPRVAGPDRGAIVCVCHDIGTFEIEDAIAGGANTLPAIGRSCRAGNNCGSCRPELARMLESAVQEIKEAAE
ncbi:MAG: molybdopterin-dependent oxidoreductase [Erythrobacter sp.]|uniref:nitrate reductase n=1 Tax=Erythrobacter sp. TaxID=1042 RepID=UPI003262F346